MNKTKNETTNNMSIEKLLLENTEAMHRLASAVEENNTYLRGELGVVGSEPAAEPDEVKPEEAKPVELTPTEKKKAELSEQIIELGGTPPEKGALSKYKKVLDELVAKAEAKAGEAEAEEEEEEDLLGGDDEQEVTHDDVHDVASKLFTHEDAAKRATAKKTVRAALQEHDVKGLYKIPEEALKPLFDALKNI